MIERRVVVTAPDGLHARPAAEFVTAAFSQPALVTLRKAEGEPVAATSILAVMTLDIQFGDEITLAAQGEGAEESVAALAQLLIDAPGLP